HRLGRWPMVLVFGGLLFVFLDLQAAPENWTYAIVILGACIVVAAAFWQRLAILTCITVGTFYVASLPRSSASIQVSEESASGNVPNASALPPLLHVILDEQWGIGGLLAEKDTATAAFLSEFYLSRGFELFPAAYSRYDRTRESIPQLVSLGERTRLDSAANTSPPRYTLSSIPYFEVLRSRGYRIRVYQTSYLDHCAAPNAQVVSCETQEGNSIANIGYLPGNWIERAELAGRFFLNVSSHIYRRLHPDPVSWRRANAGGGLLTLQRARDAIASQSVAGTAYFVHVLLPHRPATVDEQCGARADEPPVRQPGLGLNDEGWRWTIQRSGWQIRCTHRALGDVITGLERAAGSAGAIIIVHGDHGSRMFQRDLGVPAVAALDGRQLNGFYSTLLAVRRPSVPPRIFSEPVPVQDFIWAFARSGFARLPNAGWRHFVYGPPTPAIRSDTVRFLTELEMLWVSTPQRALTDSSTRAR
ncbi:MAG: hypothetical protein AB1762_18415, partial [Gemmatimonadota bacterium]